MRSPDLLLAMRVGLDPDRLDAIRRRQLVRRLLWALLVALLIWIVVRV